MKTLPLIALILSQLSALSAQAAQPVELQCVINEVVGGREETVRPRVAFGDQGAVTLDFASSIGAGISGTVTSTDSNILIAAHDSVTGMSITSQAMGLGAVAILKMGERPGRFFEIDCLNSTQ